LAGIENLFLTGAVYPTIILAGLPAPIPCPCAFLRKQDAGALGAGPYFVISFYFLLEK
jgi:hypothetical protein